MEASKTRRPSTTSHRFSKLLPPRSRASSQRVVRVFQMYFSRESELKVFQLLAQRGLGPALLATFEDGRVEEFLDGRVRFEFCARGRVTQCREGTPQISLLACRRHWLALTMRRSDEDRLFDGRDRSSTVEKCIYKENCKPQKCRMPSGSDWALTRSVPVRSG